MEISNGVATIYNVGKINEDELPSAKLIAVVGSQPLSNSSLYAIITTHSPKSQEKFSSSRKNDSVGHSLTAAQQEYFADSKIRDADGNLLVVYHGTDGYIIIVE